MRIATTIFFKAITLSILTTTAFARPGDLDTRFGGSGIVTTPAPAMRGLTPGPIAIDHDNRSITTGNLGSGIFVHAKNASGDVDTSFGTSGFVLTDFGGTTSLITGLAIDGDNRIVVAGPSTGTTTYITVARFLSNGASDTAFGSGGISTISLPSGVEPGGLVISKRGDIYIVGSAVEGAENLMSIAKMDSTGTLDAGFGSGGVSILHLTAPSEYTEGAALTVDDSGDVYATGRTYIGPPPGAYFNATAKLNTAGKLDTTFGGGKGFVLTDTWSATIYHYNFGQSIALDGAGRIVIAGSAGDYAPITHPSGHSSFYAIRYLPNGTLDASFNGTGIFLSPQTSGTRQASSVLIDGRGSIVLTGQFALDGATVHRQITAMRISDSGTLDAGFGTSGTVALSGYAWGGTSALTQGGDIMIFTNDNGSPEITQTSLVGYDLPPIWWPPVMWP